MQMTTWQADNTSNKFQHVGTLKYNKVFTTRRHTCLTCRLCYQRIVHKYKCLSFFPFSFFHLLIERERECAIAVLSFLTVSSESISLLGAGGFIYIALAWRHRFFLSKILSASSPGVRHDISPSVQRDISLQNIPYFRLRKRGLFLL